MKIGIIGAGAIGRAFAMQAVRAGYEIILSNQRGPRCITVNLIQPGPIDTDMNPADSPFSD